MTISHPVVTFNKLFQGLFCIRLVSDLYELNIQGIGMISALSHPCHGFWDSASGVVSYTAKRRS